MKNKGSNGITREIGDSESPENDPSELYYGQNALRQMRDREV